MMNMQEESDGNVGLIMSGTRLFQKQEEQERFSVAERKSIAASNALATKIICGQNAERDKEFRSAIVSDIDTTKHVTFSTRKSQTGKPRIYQKEEDSNRKIKIKKQNKTKEPISLLEQHLNQRDPEQEDNQTTETAEDAKKETGYEGGDNSQLGVDSFDELNTAFESLVSCNKDLWDDQSLLMTTVKHTTSADQALDDNSNRPMKNQSPSSYNDPLSQPTDNDSCHFQPLVSHNEPVNQLEIKEKEDFNDALQSDLLQDKNSNTIESLSNKIILNQNSLIPSQDNETKFILQCKQTKLSSKKTFEESQHAEALTKKARTNSATRNFKGTHAFCQIKDCLGTECYMQRDQIDKVQWNDSDLNEIGNENNNIVNSVMISLSANDKTYNCNDAVKEMPLCIHGDQINASGLKTRIKWQVSAPKRYLDPHLIMIHHCPEYQGCKTIGENAIAPSLDNTTASTETLKKKSRDQIKTIHTDDLPHHNNNFVQRQCVSACDHKYSQRESTSDHYGGSIKPRDTTTPTDLPHIQRLTKSMPNLISNQKTGNLNISTDFDSFQTELQYQIKQYNRTYNKTECVNIDTTISHQTKSNQSDVNVSIRQYEALSRTSSDNSSEVSEIAEDAFRVPSRTLSEPTMEANNKNKTINKRYISHQSLCGRLDFDGSLGVDYHGAPQFVKWWIKETFWYHWIDERFTNSISSSSDQELTKQINSPIISSNGQRPNEDTDIDEDIKPMLSADHKNDIVTEIEHISSSYHGDENGPSLTAFDLCRRGALYLKIGHLQNSLSDLNNALVIEPGLIDAYWHRHVIHRIHNDIKHATNDLLSIVKRKPNEAKAYRSLGDVCFQRNEWTMAIANYSEAIKLEPSNVDLYYSRAETFEKRGDVLLTLDDYKTANELKPNRTEAIFHIAMHYFETSSWNVCITNFDILLSHQPCNAVAYLFRGQALMKMGHFERAVGDFASVIHLQPNNRQAYYLRGCLLRRVSPQLSISDLSKSLLIDSSPSNINAFMHRAIVYSRLRRWKEALCDFQAVIRLNPKNPFAHINIGLIHLEKMRDPFMAIRKFNAAVRCDPTCVRGYLCRSEAHERIGKFALAAKDVAKAMHLMPWASDLKIARGRLLLKLGKFDLASFLVRQSAAAIENEALVPAIQASVIKSFFKEFKEAIEILEKEIKRCPNYETYLLLGKTLMKCNEFKKAIDVFSLLLLHMHPQTESKSWPIEAGIVHYHTAMCYKELNANEESLISIREAIRINPSHSEAYHQKGLIKIRLKQGKAILEFNRSLAHNPTTFQVYLSRAAYYASKKRLTKAVLNCNEALRIQPQSARAYLYRGCLKCYFNSFKLAKKDFTSAISLDTCCILAYYGRAICFQRTRSYQRALKDYGIVLLASDHLKLKVLVNRALLYFEINDLQNAIRDLEQVNEERPKDHLTLLTLGVFYHRRKWYGKASAAITSAMAARPFDTDLLIGRGNVAMDCCQSEEEAKAARSDFVRALHLDPQSQSARIHLAYHFQAHNKFHLAWQLLTQSIQTAWDSRHKQLAYEGRAIVNLQMLNIAGALTDINHAVERGNNSQMLCNRGVIHEFSGDDIMAFKDYKGAVLSDPSCSLGFYNIGTVYLRQRRYKEAINNLDKAIAWNENDESALLNRALAKAMLGLSNDALKDFHLAEMLCKSFAHLYVNRGKLLMSLSRFEEALQDLNKAVDMRSDDPIVYNLRSEIRARLGHDANEVLKDYQSAVFFTKE